MEKSKTQTETDAQKAALRSMVQDYQELKRHLKSQSKNQLIQNIVNLISNQLTLIDTLQALQARLPKEEQKKEETNV